MTLEAKVIKTLAKRLDAAETQCKDIVKITDDYPDMDWDDAYAIQDALRALKTARGARVAGLKMGLTSHAKMKQMGVIEPVRGFLTDYGQVPDGGECPAAGLIHPKVEAEIAFVTKAPLKGPGCHIGDVLAAADFVLPALEVIDSRYRDFKFDLKSVIADNTSAARYVVGGRSRDVDGLDLKHMGVVMEKNGKVVATASGAAILGHPAQSIAMLANMLGARGEAIPAGTLILAGSATEAIAVAAGDNITVRYQDLGSVSVRFV
jgi:2-oxo-3-hexenedioate decarboxylase